MVSEEFLTLISDSIEQEEFGKLTLSKFKKSTDLLNVYVKPIVLRSEQLLHVTYHYLTKDIVKNYTLTELKEAVLFNRELGFKGAFLLTDSSESTLLVSKKGQSKIITKSIDTPQAKPSDAPHDRKKTTRVHPSEPYLQYLGISTAQGQIKPSMYDKYRQINKYLEILDHDIQKLPQLDTLKIADMGSGKGYLTFALYAHLSKSMKVEVTGVEFRPDLVKFCNEVAQQCGFDGLTFEENTIQEFKPDQLDVLIALHACDTATDDSIAKGLKSGAHLIVCAPCCHKQIRKEVLASNTINQITKHGIFLERTCEMVTDSIRALILENHGYKTKVFEFVSNEHTRKNILLTALKSSSLPRSDSSSAKIQELKAQYGIATHYLETIL